MKDSVSSVGHSPAACAGDGTPALAGVPSNNRDNGGSAFPLHPYARTDYGMDGMSLRDYFAAKALPSVITQCAADTMHGMAKADYFAGRAYELADAMLKARSA